MSLKEKIIDETLKLFSLKGYNNTSIHDILEAAGTSKGGFYNHFKSKEELFFQVLERARAGWRQRTLDGLERIEKPVEKVEKLLRNYKDRYLKDSLNFPGGCVFITLSVELNDQNPGLFAEIDKGFIGLKRMIRRYLEDGKAAGALQGEVDPGMVTEVLFNGMLGASVCYGAGKSAAGLDTTIEALVAYLNTLKR
ncbi:MAG: TetR/AcrR family transcriptional regulator [bacterium]